MPIKSYLSDLCLTIIRIYVLYYKYKLEEIKMFNKLFIFVLLTSLSLSQVVQNSPFIRSLHLGQNFIEFKNYNHD